MQEQEQEAGGASDLGRRPRQHEPSEDEDLGSEEENEVENDEVGDAHMLICTDAYTSSPKRRPWV